MEYVGETANHYYSLRDKLGQGAYSCVFLGYNKGTGEKRALKVPKRAGATKATQRETEALLSLRHTNIVQLFGVEDEMVSYKTVIVMEYCSGGSVQTMLQEPEYMNGLPDRIFLLLLTHLASGLKELIIKGFVHRDIKPANILITKSVPNEITFKISDFGSSRQNDTQLDEDMCLSLAGTEEYLHPLLYKGAFIQKSSHVKANSCVDKWALGVTLHHAATGDVPFKPFGGARKNRQTMFFMISQKPRGKLSGFQETENGKIQWSSEFSSSCNITSGLRSRLVPILLGLMEADNSNQWSYDTFFREVELIDNAIPVYILNTCSAQYLTVYLHTNARVPILYEMIAKETDIDSNNQRLHFENTNFKELVEFETTIKDLPKTSRDTPLLLSTTLAIDSCSNHIIQNGITSLDNANSRNEILVKLGRKAACIIADLCNIVEEIHHAKQCVQEFISNLRKTTKERLQSIKKEFHLLSMVAEERIAKLSLSSMSSIQSDSLLRTRGSKQSLLSISSSSSLQIKKITEYIRDKLFDVDDHIQKNEKLTECLSDKTSLCSSKCVDILKGYLQTAKETLHDIHKYSCVRERTPLDFVRNKSLRDNILQTAYRAKIHWQNHCDSDKKIFFNRIQDILREEIDVSEKIRLLSNHIDELKEEINNPSMNVPFSEATKMSISCSDDMQSIFKESTKIETDGLICSSKDSLTKLLQESTEFESLLDDMTIDDI